MHSAINAPELSMTAMRPLSPIILDSRKDTKCSIDWKYMRCRRDYERDRQKMISHVRRVNPIDVVPP